MKTFTPLFVAAGIVSFAAAQNYPTVTPDDVDIQTREAWCTQQTAVCPNICQDQAQVDAKYNDCSPDDLTYECVCMDGTTPNLTEYSLTMPYYLCMQSKQMCADNCQGEQNCADQCFTGKQCGASNPKRTNSTTTTSAGPSATGTSTATGSGSTATSTNNPFNVGNIGARLESFGSAYGAAAMVIGMAVGFAGML